MFFFENELKKESDILFFNLHTFEKQFRTNTENYELFTVQRSGSIEEPSRLLNQDAS